MFKGKLAKRARDAGVHAAVTKEAADSACFDNRNFFGTECCDPEGQNVCCADYSEAHQMIKQRQAEIDAHGTQRRGQRTLLEGRVDHLTLSRSGRRSVSVSVTSSEDPPIVIDFAESAEVNNFMSEYAKAYFPCSRYGASCMETFDHYNVDIDSLPRGFRSGKMLSRRAGLALGCEEFSYCEVSSFQGSSIFSIYTRNAANWWPQGPRYLYQVERLRLRAHQDRAASFLEYPRECQGRHSFTKCISLLPDWTQRFDALLTQGREFDPIPPPRRALPARPVAAAPVGGTPVQPRRAGRPRGPR
eukprot:GFYU01012375.1.p1 GENE.GFYU01012375.1~~GFYU01012375.1.p1  ORF type:complete len:321 (+),score=43.01 GFYU01012375.1:58-963(+)